MPIPTPQERLGQLIDERYRLESLLSTGGMGVLFRGLDVTNGTPVAVKTLKPAFALEPERVARFLRETSIAERVRHPNVARMLGASSDDSGAPFLILELLEGHTLEHELERRGTLPLVDVIAIVLPIMCALEAAHGLGVIHRDVKPSNIFLSATGPKLLDFGIAKSSDAAFETQTGVFVGSPGYVAPEQALYAECSPQTDVWAMGAVLYRCLTGYAPHTEVGDSDLFGRLVRDPVPPLTAAGVSKRACATIERALARDPHRRYPSMQGFARALEALVQEEPCADTCDLPRPQPSAAVASLSTIDSSASRRWRPRVKGALVTATLIGISGSAGSSETRGSTVASATVAPARVAVDMNRSLDPQPLAPFDERVLLRVQPDPEPMHEPARRPTAHAVRAAHRAVKVEAAANTPPLRPAANLPTAPIEHEATSGLPVVTQW